MPLCVCIRFIGRKNNENYENTNFKLIYFKLFKTLCVKVRRYRKRYLPEQLQELE